MTRLSPRLRVIALAVAEGKINKEIAYEEGITESTVKVYCYRICQKLGLANRVALAVWVTEQKRNPERFESVRSWLQRTRISADQAREIVLLVMDRDNEDLPKAA